MQADAKVRPATSAFPDRMRTTCRRTGSVSAHIDSAGTTSTAVLREPTASRGREIPDGKGDLRGSDVGGGGEQVVEKRDHRGRSRFEHGKR